MIIFEEIKLIKMILQIIGSVSQVIPKEYKLQILLLKCWSTTENSGIEATERIREESFTKSLQNQFKHNRIIKKIDFYCSQRLF